jgi:hypothetical protein
MRKRNLIIIVAGLCLFFLSVNIKAAEIENSCVSCHRDIPRDTFIGSKYQDWEGSIHAKEGIACERCHGGNPSARQKEGAHGGIYNSGNPLSRVYYKSVPGTCGACHRQDFNAFRRSAHYSILERTGGGPTCVTCHESHTTRIISPGQIPSVCEQCHNERMRISPQVPVQAQALLLLINETAFLVRYSKGRIASDDIEGLQTWRNAYEIMQTTRDEWHAFNLKQVQMKILNVYNMILRFLEQKN